MLVPDKIIRSNRRTLSISIDAFGRLIVRAPQKVSEEKIIEFINEKEDWILRKQREKTETGMRLPPESLEGYSFLLLGKDCRIRLTKAGKVVFDPNANIVYVPAHNAKAKLVNWLKVNAKRLFTSLTEEKAKTMRTKFKSVSISSARTRWGSCSFDNSIRYSFRLLYAPKEVIEYIVVHELAHTKQKNHSPAFWKVVEKYEPEYKKRKEWLETYSGLMEIF
ncbi:MAG: M48 family metallopeptidase [Clostridia bacterium]|nr:M48 family metallopeptidase [Clostridia bacterium]